MRTLVAILALSPALLHAQAKLPAQPVPTPSLHASLLPPAEPFATPDTAKPNTGRVSTGVIPARLLHAVNLQESSDRSLPSSHAERFVRVALTVAANGKTEDARIVGVTDPFTSQAVLDAVAQFRYQPATVSGIPVESPVNLEITVLPN